MDSTAALLVRLKEDVAKRLASEAWYFGVWRDTCTKRNENQKTMRYTGFEDGGRSGCSRLSGRYGLVFTFPSLADSYSQPIAVFARDQPRALFYPN